MIASDEIKVDISISNFSTGAIVLTNLHTSQVFSKRLNSPGPKANLQGKSAEWIVEAYARTTITGKEELVNLANFRTVNLTNCRASAQKTDFKLTDPRVASFLFDAGAANQTKVVSNTHRLMINFPFRWFRFSLRT